MEEVTIKIERFAYDLIYSLLWIVEAFLLLRFLLKLLGANPYNSIVAFLYSVSLVFMGPFAGIFGVVRIDNMTLEPSVLVAMIFYAIIAYLLASFLDMIHKSNMAAPH